MKQIRFLGDKPRLSSIIGVVAASLCFLIFFSLPAQAAGGNDAQGQQYFTHEDLIGKRIGVCMGYGADVAMTNSGQYTVARYLGGTEFAIALKAGNLDAFAAERSYAEQLVREIPGLVILPGTLGPESYVAAFRMDNKELRDEVDAAIGEIMASPEYEEMIGRWLGGDPDSADMPEIPEGTGESLIVALESEYEPFAYFTEGGKRHGFDVEMIYRIGALLGRKIEFFETSYSSLFVALDSNYADMSLCAIDDKPALRERYQVTRQYYNNEIVMVVLSGETGSDASFSDGLLRSLKNHLVVEKRYMYIVEGILNTLIISLLAASIGTLLGALLCSLTRCKRRAARVPAEFFVRVMQGTPIVVLLLIVTYVVFAGSGMDTVIVSGIAFSLYFSSGVTEIFRASLGAVDSGQVEAAKAMGLSSPQAYRLVYIPQAVVMALPVYSANLVDMVKLTSVVGYVGVMDLTYSLEIIRSRTYEAMFPMLLETLLYIILTSIITTAFRALLNRIDPKRKERRVRL